MQNSHFARSKVEIYDLGGTGESVRGSCTVTLIQNGKKGDYNAMLTELWKVVNLDLDAMKGAR